MYQCYPAVMKEKTAEAYLNNNDAVGRKRQCCHRMAFILMSALIVSFVFCSFFAENADALKLNDTLVASGDVFNFQISPDGSRVVYNADQDTDGDNELYSVPIGGGTVTKLNSTLVTDGDVLGGFQISPDGSRVVYRADQDTDDVFELYVEQALSIPTMTQWGMILFMMLAGLGAVYYLLTGKAGLRRKRIES